MNTSEITTCPKCKMRVLPKQGGTCPSCQYIIQRKKPASNLLRDNSAKKSKVISNPKRKSSALSVRTKAQLVIDAFLEKIPMSPSLLSRGFIERIKLFIVLNTTMSQYGAPQTSREATAEAVKVLEAKVKEKPKEWIIWYALGDWYSALGEYAKAVRACETCYELRPRDPRSAYGLATTLRMLTRAKYLDHPKAKDIQEFMAESGLSGYDEFDPLKSQHRLDKLGLTIDQAAERSLALFEEVITLGVNDSDAKMVKDHLAAMYSEFPHLERSHPGSRRCALVLI